MIASKSSRAPWVRWIAFLGRLYSWGSVLKEPWISSGISVATGRVSGLQPVAGGFALNFSRVSVEVRVHESPERCRCKPVMWSIARGVAPD